MAASAAGPSDKDVLSAWFPELLLNPRIGILHGRGGDNARHADQLAAWLAGADRLGLRRVLYLCDRDELSDDVLPRLMASSTVHVLERRELENYLLEPEAVAETLATIIPGGDAAPSAADIAGALVSAADGLRRQVIVNRVARQVAPPTMLMDHTLRKKLADDGADKAQITEAVLGRLMTTKQLRQQIATAWANAEAEVNGCDGLGLLGIAPGEEVLDRVFTSYSDASVKATALPGRHRGRGSAN